MSHEGNMERLLTIDDVAETLRISRASVYRMIRRAELRPVLIQGRKRVPYSQIKALMAPETEVE